LRHLRRELTRWAQEAYQISEWHAARLVKLAVNTLRYGYRRLTVLLRRDLWHVNAKRIYRLYRDEGLIVRTKQRRKIAR
jgi:hypothetical protein